MQGVVTYVRPDKGFGFIRCDQLPRDVFFHVNQVAGYTLPAIRECVEFTLTQSQDGRPCANDVYIISGVRVD